MKAHLRLAHYDPNDERINDNVPDRDFAAGVLSALEVLASEDVVRRGWDAPPLLGLLYLQARTPVGQQGPVRGGLLEWQALAGSEQLAQARRQHHVIVGLARMYQSMPPELKQAAAMPARMVGLALLNEGWQLNTPLGDPEEVRRAKDAARARTIHEHPDRIEVKMLTAVDVHGVRYQYMRPRDTRVTLQQAGAGIFDPQMPGSAIGGEVPTSLEYLMLTFQGRTLPPYQEWSEEHDYPEDMGE